MTASSPPAAPELWHSWRDARPRAVLALYTSRRPPPCGVLPGRLGVHRHWHLHNQHLLWQCRIAGDALSVWVGRERSASARQRRHGPASVSQLGGLRICRRMCSCRHLYNGIR
jgi:hypothetical protein